MSRLSFLLCAGLAALPVGCVVLPHDESTSYKAPLTDPKAEAFLSADLSEEQAAKVCLATAQVLEKKGHEKEAVLEYQQARVHSPRLPGVARRLAVLFDRLGDSEHARTEYVAALREQPQDADLLNDAGYFHYQQGETADAEKYLRQALALNARHQRAWVNLGKVLARQGRYEESCEAFGRVVRPAQAAANLGVLLAKEGKVVEARQVLHKALGLEPDLKAARLLLTQLEAGGKPEVRLTAE